MRVIIALVFVFVGGAVLGVVVAAVLGTAARQRAIERSYWSGVRAASDAVSNVSAVSLIGRRQLARDHRMPRGGAEPAVEETRRVG